MKIIADSGSTKTDWAFGGKLTETIGFNPMFHDVSFIGAHIVQNTELKAIGALASEVNYYGAACSSVARNKIVETALKACFPNAKVHVNHDIAGAVYATCKNEPGTACILGTGSNCVFFNGTEIKSYTSALGFILGDEGGGTYIGKKLLADFINNKLPKEIIEYLKNTHALSKEEIFSKVYNNTNANKYLASFAKVLSNFKEDTYTINVLDASFSAFIETHILAIPNVRDYPIHFVGSIATYYSEALEASMQKHQLSIGKIIPKPIHELVKYHHEI